MTWGITRYEIKLQLRSLVFWLVLVLVALMFKGELYDEPAGKIPNVVAYRQDRERYLGTWRPEYRAGEQAHMEDLVQHGFDSTAWAGTWADRMEIVFAFAALFTAGFMLERDRLTRSREVVSSRPAPPGAYLAGKYLGAVLPLLGATLVTMGAAYGINVYLNAQLGFTARFLPYLRAWALLLAPTVLYATAAVLLLASLLSRAAMAIPLYLAYFFVAGLVPVGGHFRLDLTTFILRAEGRAQEMWQAPALHDVLTNRGLYLGLTLVLVLLAGWVHGLRRRRGDLS
jgi:hypothetical protein